MPALYREVCRTVMHATQASGHDFGGLSLHMHTDTWVELVDSGWNAGAQMLFFGIPVVLQEDIPAGEIRFRREVTIQLPV